MEKIWPILITMLISLLAVAIAYRVNPIHKLVFGKGSALLDKSASLAVDSAPVAVGGVV